MGEERQVSAVVVAYNRAKLLRECLDAIAAQTRPVQRVIVIDNASTDDSAHIAQQHPVVDRVIPLSENTGGAGGFCAGIAHALAYKELESQDFIWIMDDSGCVSTTANSGADLSRLSSAFGVQGTVDRR